MPTASLLWAAHRSIAHESGSPIATARNNACAALNFLGRHPPDLSELKQALDCIVADAIAPEISSAGSGLSSKKAPPRKEVVDLNAAILEVTALTHGEAVRSASRWARTGGRVAMHPGRSCATATSDVELDPQCIQSMSSVGDGNRDYTSHREYRAEGVVRRGAGYRPWAAPREPAASL